MSARAFCEPRSTCASSSMPGSPADSYLPAGLTPRAWQKSSWGSRRIHCPDGVESAIDTVATQLPQGFPEDVATTIFEGMRTQARRLQEQPAA